MSDYSGGMGWWQASDGKWYPPQPVEDHNQRQQPYQPYNSIQQQSYPQAGNQQQSYQPAGYGGGYYQPIGQMSAGKKKRLIPILVVMFVVVVLVAGTVVALLKSNEVTGSPIKSAQTYLTAIENDNQAQACGVVDPQNQTFCSTMVVGLEKSFSGKVKEDLHAADDYVDGNQAIVAITGKLCVSIKGTQSCFSNSDPKSGLPASNSTFTQAWNNVLSHQNHFINVLCVLIGNTWYVYLSPNSSSGNSGSNTGNSGSNSGTSRRSAAANNLGNSIIEVSAVYTQDNGQFGATNASDTIGELQMMEPSITYRYGSLSISVPHVNDVVQVDACGNAATVTNCQWVAMAAFSEVHHVCYYVFVNKGSPLGISSLAMGNWSGPAITGTTIAAGTYYATSGKTPVSSCNVMSDSPSNVTASGFPSAPTRN